MFTLMRPSTTTLSFIEEKNAHFASEEKFKNSLSLASVFFDTTYEHLIKKYSLGAYAEHFYLSDELRNNEDYINAGLISDSFSNVVVFDLDRFNELKKDLKKEISNIDYNNFKNENQFDIFSFK